MTETQLTFQGTALTDLLLVASARRSNVLSSHPYIPGAALRGHLAQRWLRDRDDDERFRTIFESGAVRFHTAHPTVGQQATLPAPLSRRTCKTDPHEPGHFSEDTLGAQHAPVCASHGAQPTATKRVHGVIAPDGTVIDPDRMMVTRGRIATVDDAEGSGLAERNKLFTERRIGAGTTFVFEIDGQREALEQLVELLERHGDVITVGRARSVLGAVETSTLELRDRPTNEAAGTGPLTVTFLSDTILLDSWHRSILALDNEAVLAKMLSLELDRPISDTDIEILGSAVRATSVGGWDGREGGHKPIEPAIAAGSAVRIALQEPELRVLLGNKGALGWRTAEGFGRIGIDHWGHMVTLRAPSHDRSSERIDAHRDRIAQVARDSAVDLARRHAVSRSLWQGIEATIRSGQVPQTGGTDGEPGTGQHAQSRSGRSAMAGRAQRLARRAAVEAFNAACAQLSIPATGTDAINLADDIGRELDLIDAKKRAN